MSATPHVPAIHVEQLEGLASLSAAVELVSSAYDFRRHPYFLWAWSAQTDRAAFRASQAPFRFAVEGWAQALSAVLARTPRCDLRRGLVRNVADEHGESAERGHAASFDRYLVALGATDAERRGPCPIAVRAFVEAMTNFCLVHPYEAGAAALGIVEHLYIGISADIGRQVVDRGWAAPGAQDHYAVHEELDVHHARDLLELARPAWTDARGRGDVALGLALGAHSFWQLYRDLLPAR